MQPAETDEALIQFSFVFLLVLFVPVFVLFPLFITLLIYPLPPVLVLIYLQLLQFSSCRYSLYRLRNRRG